VQALADFSDGLLGGAVLLALSVAVGGVVWGLVVLRGRRAAPALTRVCLGLVAAGALGLAVAQTAALAAKALVLGADVDPWTFLGALLGTLEFRAGGMRVGLALALAVAAARLRRAPAERGGWIVVGVLAAAVMVCGAWLAHAASRLEGRAPLMALTALHELAAAVWVGGVIHLGAAWRAARRTPELAGEWPGLPSRFSRVAVAAVGLLLASAAPLAWNYVGSWAALVGTGYGSLVVTKAVLMAATLGLAAVNFRAARGGGAAVWTTLPPLAEAEAVLLAIVLFAAATLSSAPPAADTIAERASGREVVEVFRPKWPALRTPSVETMAHDSSDPLAVVGGERTHDAYAWSNFSHNVAGLILLAMALVALAGRSGGVRWARHWPLGFLALAVFVFLRTSANDGVWPFGARPFWSTTLGDPEVVQHRLGAVLVLALGLVEWRARLTRRRDARLPYVFPVLAAVGGVLLLTHAHAVFEPKSGYLIQVTHTAMGALAVLIAAGRWLELRLAPPAARLAGTASTAAMLLVALVLVFYREANVLVAP
jgi:copper resistance protein D